MNMNDAFLGSLIFNKNEGGGIVLITKDIDESGVYNASDDNADGYSSVKVNIPKSGLIMKNMEILNSTYTTI